MGYSNRKPYYELDKGYLEYSRTSNRFLKQSIAKESVFEKPYLEAEYPKMQLKWSKPTWPGPISPIGQPKWPGQEGSGKPVGAFGRISKVNWLTARYIFPPPSCGLSSEVSSAWVFHWWNDCGDISTISFSPNSFFKTEWDWTFALSSANLDIGDISRKETNESISIWTDIPGTSGTVLVCGRGRAGQPLPKVWERPFKKGESFAFLPGFLYKEVAAQKGGIYCCKEVEFDCDSCVDDAAMAYDYDTSAATIAQNESVTVAVTGLNAPFIWSVSGTGFSLASAKTTGLINTLIADESSCGSATITVTGCDNVSVTGYVRSTIGKWILKSNDCVLSGAGTCTQQANGLATYEIILGNKKQYQEVEYAGGGGYYGCYDPETDCPGYSGVYNCKGCITWACTDMLYTGYCDNCCCYDADVPDPCGGAGSKRIAYCVKVSELSYYEWECAP